MFPAVGFALFDMMGAQICAAIGYVLSARIVAQCITIGYALAATISVAHYVKL